VFSVQNKDMFEIPLKEVTNTSLTAKHEVMIELGGLDGEGSGGKDKRKGDQLVEMRFYVPGNKPQEGEGEEESAANVRTKKKNTLLQGDMVHPVCDTLTHNTITFLS